MNKALIAICAVLVGCSKPQVTVHAGFDHWTGADGRTQWILELPPETWRQLSHGEPLDASHQDLSERSRQVVKELIDKNLEHMHLCPENWTMDDARSFENGYITFSGNCDTPTATRT